MIFQAMRWVLPALFLSICGVAGEAAQYAAVVMDARSGKVVHSENADKRLHPASLTKMMTLYLVFEEVRAGRLKLEQKITISKYAAGKPPSKLGLRAGQKIELKYLIRAAAVKSANDAAAALAEAVSGSEAKFAKRMTATARAMGMSKTTFKNASGLTSSGHLSTARDMAVLGRRLFYDFPQYYNLFSRRSTNAKLKTVNNTNRRLLDAYPGADGIKTGYTNAAGYNLVSSARRGNERVIVSLFGGRSAATRNAAVAKLMDLGFRKMPTFASVRRPGRIYLPAPGQPFAVAKRGGRLPTDIKVSARPLLRAFGADRPDPVSEMLLASAIDQAVSSIGTKASTDQQIELQEVLKTRPPAALADITPRARPSGLGQGAAVARAAEPVPLRAPGGETYVLELAGKYNRNEAERLLLATALQEMEALGGSRRHLQPTSSRGWYKAQFVGLTARDAQAACARLAARQTGCQVMAKGG